MSAHDGVSGTWPGPRFSRRAFGLAAGALGATLLAGCGRAVIGLDPVNASLDIGNGAEPLSLDPHKASGQWENNIIGNLLVGLTTDGPDAAIIPGIAERWETSEDGLTWTFYLRAAQWSDGRPCDAYDFEYAYRRILHPDTIAEYASILYPILNAQACKSGDLPIEALGVRAVDARTFEIRLEHPAPYLPGLLKHYTSFPVPRHIVEAHGDDWIKPENAVWNGAFRLVKWWSNYIVHLAKNERFFDAQNVALKELFFYPSTDDDAAARRVMRGEIAWSTRFPGKKQDLYDREIPGFARTHPWLLNNYFSLNTSRPPFNDVRVRRALSMAIDRRFLAYEIWKAGYEPAYGFVPPGIAGYPEGARLFFADWPKERRLEEARRLLEEAGYGPSNPLRFTFKHRNSGDNPRVAVVAQADWRAIAPWVQAELRGQEVQIHYADLRAGDFEAGDGGWIADYNDAKNYLFLLETRTGNQNYSRYSNPAYDQLMLAADQERDAERRFEIMRQAEQIAVDDCPIIPVAIGASTNLVHPRVTGWVENIEDVHRARWMGISDADVSA